MAPRTGLRRSASLSPKLVNSLDDADHLLLSQGLFRFVPQHGYAGSTASAAKLDTLLAAPAAGPAPAGSVEVFTGFRPKPHCPR
jgi:hypothetical protein